MVHMVALETPRPRRELSDSRMETSFRFATLDDVERLLPLMQDFYAFEQLDYDEVRQRRLVAELIADQTLGRLILFEQSYELVGYMVLGFGFARILRSRLPAR